MASYYVWGRDTARSNSGLWAFDVEAPTPEGIRAEVARFHPNGARAVIEGFREREVVVPPPPPQPVYYAAIVAAVGERVWGASWPSGIAHLIGESPRTMQRLATAAREGRDYRGADRILAQVHTLLGDVTLALKPWAAHPAAN
jgi:hypothetical protein